MNVADERITGSWEHAWTRLTDWAYEAVWMDARIGWSRATPFGWRSWFGPAQVVCARCTSFFSSPTCGRFMGSRWFNLARHAVDPIQTHLISQQFWSNLDVKLVSSEPCCPFYNFLTFCISICIAASVVDPLHLEYFEFAGRMIALALRHKIHAGLFFNRTLFLQLAGRPITTTTT